MPEMKIVKLSNAPNGTEPNTLYAFPDLFDSSQFIFMWTSADGTSSRHTVSMMNINEFVDAKMAGMDPMNLRVNTNPESGDLIEKLNVQGQWEPYTFDNEFSDLVKRSSIVAATSEMTQPVGITANGKLLTYPSAVTTTVRTYSLPNVGDECLIELDGIIGVHYVKTTNGGYEGYKVDLQALVTNRVIGFRRDTIYDNVSPEGANGNNISLVVGTPYSSDALSYGSMREYTRKIIIDMETLVSWKIEVFGFGVGQLRFVIERCQDSTV